jgi:hypothetical protein
MASATADAVIQGYRMSAQPATLVHFNLLTPYCIDRMRRTSSAVARSL